MPYLGPGSALPLCGEFLAHWTLTNQEVSPPPPDPPVEFSVIVATGIPARTRADFHSRADTYGGFQTGLQDLRNTEELTRGRIDGGRDRVQALISAFNRKVRGALGHTSFPSALPEVPGASSGLHVFAKEGGDMVSLWKQINALPATPEFDGPLTVPLPIEGTAEFEQVALGAEVSPAAGTARHTLAQLAADEALLTETEQKLATRRRERDEHWEKELRPIASAYRDKVQGEFPAGHPLVQTLPRLWTLPGSTPNPVPASGAWDNDLSVAVFNYTPSENTDLSHHQLRGNIGATYDSDSAIPIETHFPGQPPTFQTTERLANPGDTASYKVYVVLNSGHERGSETITITRPL